MNESSAIDLNVLRPSLARIQCYHRWRYANLCKMSHLPTLLHSKFKSIKFLEWFPNLVRKSRIERYYSGVPSDKPIICIERRFCEYSKSEFIAYWANVCFSVFRVWLVSSAFTFACTPISHGIISCSVINPSAVSTGGSMLQMPKRTHRKRIVWHSFGTAEQRVAQSLDFNMFATQTCSVCSRFRIGYQRHEPN